MAKRETHQSEPTEQANDLAAVMSALTQVAELLANSSTQMTRGLDTLQQMLDRMTPAPAGEAPATISTAVRISTYEDDPFSEEAPTVDPPDAPPIQVTVPPNDNPLLQFQIQEQRPAPTQYAPGTAEFRYWIAMEALTRGIDFWTRRLPAGTRWTTLQEPMRVTLVAGNDLNANYSRQFGLRFYQATVRGRQFFSGESPDVTCHELGHAILDALRPELFNAASIEGAAFHESFGDMSAILSALQLDSLCETVIRETGGRLNVNSRLSRLAEQLGWAIRQRSPTAVDADCLRNAANRFFYEAPRDLPASAPATQLASEAHSFSRVFTGAFLDALARMFNIVGPPNVVNLRTASGDLGQLLVDGVHLAPIAPDYFSQVARAMIQSDTTRFGGRYRSALMSGFLQHGVLMPGAMAELTNAPAPQLAIVATAAPRGSIPLTLGHESDGYRQTALNAPELPIQTIVTPYLTLEVNSPAEQPRFASALAPTHTPDDAARDFIEDLIQRGQIDFAASKSMIAESYRRDSGPPTSKRTHILDTSDGKARLKRLHFNCCCLCAGT
jgi:hypothetical protein